MTKFEKTNQSLTNPREIVLDILLEITQNNNYSHLVIRQMLSKYQYLDKRDRAFITRLAEGTIEQMIHLDYIIDQFSKVKTAKQKPVIKNILRMSVYQIKFMDSIPDSAACNEAVKLANKRGFVNLKGFVNGVLRNVARNITQISYPDVKTDYIKYLSVKYSMPEWIIKNWSKTYSYDIIEIMLNAFLTESRTTVRCVTSRASREEITRMLVQEGVAVEVSPYYENALYISDYDYLGSLETFNNGYIVVQDITSMMAGKIADPKLDDYVIDVCAAPGGKSIHVADLLQGTGTVEARDISEYKVEQIEENIQRTGIRNIRTLVKDATVLDEDSYEKADIVIADLPCSGLGIIGNKADIKYKMTAEKQIELTVLQKEILSAVSKYVKPGGSLIYSTCTINEDENENILEWFTDNFPFKLTSIDVYIPEEFRDSNTEKGFIQFIPGIQATAGFFIGKLERV